MESGDGPLAGCIVLLVFIVFNSILYGFGSAIQHLNESEIEKKAERGDKKSKILMKMLVRPEDLVSVRSNPDEYPDWNLSDT